MYFAPDAFSIFFFSVILNVSNIDSSEPLKKWVSSYETILASACFPVSGLMWGKGIPMIRSFLRIAHAKGSAYKIYNQGLIGQPYRIERDI